MDSGSGVTASKRTEMCSKVSKIITYYREYLNILLIEEDLAMSNLTISRGTHRHDAQVTSNQQENSHDCGAFSLMNAEILLRGGDISALITGVMPLLRIYIMYNLICKLRGYHLRVNA